MANLESTLNQRANSACELCEATKDLSIYQVTSDEEASQDNTLLVCKHCLDQIEQKIDIDLNHWHCLNGSMWSEFAPVQIAAYRMLYRLKSENWAADLLEQMYLDDAVLAVAKQKLIDPNAPKTRDSNGTILNNGDTVTLIKDLEVKGAGFTAKRGTTVKKIILSDDGEHIEGKVNGTQIFLLSKYLKKLKC
jgi:protein PhnA